jgi:hypothetical protein
MRLTEIKKALRIFLGKVRVDTGLASLCVYRLLAQHHPLPRALSVWVAPLTGATPFLLAQERCAKEGHPDIRVSLRETPLAPAPLRRPAYKGRPWPFKPFAASMRLIPLRNTSTRHPEGDLGVVCEIALQEQKPNATDFDFAEMSQARELAPLQEAEWNHRGRG